MKEILKDIKDKSFKSPYLLYGAESYLIKHYEELIIKALNIDLINRDEFYGKTADPHKIYAAAITLPFLAEYRLISVKSSGLFVTGRKNDSQYLLEGLPKIPESTVIIFTEREVDKRSALFKQVSKMGRAAEFKSPGEAELVKWVINNFNKNNLQIDNPTALYLLRTVNGSMDLTLREIQKLRDYAKERVTKEDIDIVTTKSLEARIFELVDAIGAKKLDRALTIYNNLMLLKESPVMVLSMTARQMRIILQVKELSGLSSSQISKETGLAPFLVASAKKQAQNFSPQELLSSLKECLDMDIAIKSGAVGAQMGVETLVLKFCS